MNLIIKKIFVLVIVSMTLFAMSCTIDNGVTPTQAPQTTPTQTPTENKDTLPSFAAEQLDGTGYHSTEFADHKLTMINVWATWCNPCIGELGHLGDIARNYESKGVDVIGLLIDLENPNAIEEAEGLLASNNANYRNIKLSQTLNDLIITKYGISSVPTTLFVDSNSNVVKVIVGAKSYEKWAAIIDGLLEG
ncbi:MAG: TlpA family protein disulfide reductase [Clostridiales bacterium]|nr:TlpA family protein disulfide reductase [Clostridiales bacterium]